MKNSTDRVFFLIICFSVLISSCHLNQDDPNDIVIVDEAIELEVIEILGTERNLGLNFTTLQPQPCQNTEIDLRISNANNRPTIFIQDLIFPDTCVEIFSPAIGQVNFGNFDISVIPVKFVLNNDIITMGTIDVRQNAILLKVDSNNGLIVNKTTTLRIPEDFGWGFYAKTESQNSENIVQQFLAEFEALTLDAAILQNGNYAYFEINPQGKMSIGEKYLPTVPYNTPKALFFSLIASQKVQLRTLILKYKRDFQADIVLNFWDDDGGNY